MQKRDLSCLVFGILITAVASCRSTNDPHGPVAQEPEWGETTFPQTDQVDVLVSTVEPLTGAAQPLTLIAPQAGEWQLLGSDRAGLSLAIPAGWADLTDVLGAADMGNRLGVNLVFAADSERTGRSLLAGKGFDRGAYVSGLLLAPAPAATDAGPALAELLAAVVPGAVRLSEPAAIASANGVSGLAVDVAAGPVGLNSVEPHDLRTRVALFLPPATGESDPAAVILLLAATTPQWSQYAGLFDGMLRSAQVFDARRGAPAEAGKTLVRGQLEGAPGQVRAVLAPGVSDLWTFSSAGGRYASLTLTPLEPRLDLRLTLLGPDREVVAQLDNGYAGATESTTDLLLAQPGVYIVDVSDLGNLSGGYTLALALASQPQHAGGGTIAFGQAMQGILPANGQHYWIFPGVAGQRASVVVEPGARNFDAVMELVGPEGQRLVALDEGFSGDPEVLSSYELPASGEYAILVRSFSPQGGPYTLSLDEGDQPIANFHDAGDLAYGDARPETLRPQEAHAWFFQGRTGDYILIRVTPFSAGLDPDVWLLDGELERVAAADSFAAGEPETIELTLAADGQYVVLVRDFNGEPGPYEVVLGAAPIATPENAGTLDYGDTVIGAVKPATTAAWTFTAQVGDVIDVAVTPAESSGDVVLRLEGPDGVTVLEVDAAAAGGAERVSGFVVPAAGAWHLLLREYFGEPVTYRLVVERQR